MASTAASHPAETQISAAAAGDLGFGQLLSAH
jgi:hypothetical protein